MRYTVSSSVRGNMRPSKIAKFLEHWSKTPEPHSLDELGALFVRLFPGVDFTPYLESAIEIGSVELAEDGRYILKRREAIVRDICFTVDRYSRLTRALVGTMVGNIEGTERIERTSLVCGLRPEDVEDFREFAKGELSETLRRIDDYLVERAVEDGISAGVSVFQFDEYRE